MSLLLGLLVITLPLTLASIGRRLWIKYTFTNKRLIVTTNSPVLQREVQVRRGLAVRLCSGRSRRHTTRRPPEGRRPRGAQPCSCLFLAPPSSTY